MEVKAGNNQSLTRDPRSDRRICPAHGRNGCEMARCIHQGHWWAAPRSLRPTRSSPSTRSMRTHPALTRLSLLSFMMAAWADHRWMGMFIALFNGGNGSDAAYNTIDLSGQVTDENGFFVIGSADVPNVDLVAFTTNGLQNGADAVALYSGAPRLSDRWPANHDKPDRRHRL